MLIPLLCHCFIQSLFNTASWMFFCEDLNPDPVTLLYQILPSPPISFLLRKVYNMLHSLASHTSLNPPTIFSSYTLFLVISPLKLFSKLCTQGICTFSSLCTEYSSLQVPLGWSLHTGSSVNFSAISSCTLNNILVTLQLPSLFPTLFFIIEISIFWCQI